MTAAGSAQGGAPALAAALGLAVAVAAVLTAASTEPAAAVEDCPWGTVACAGADDGRVTFGAREVDLGHVSRGDGPRSSTGVPACGYRPTDGGNDLDRYLLHDPNDVPWWAIFYWMDCGDRSYLRWYVDTDADPVADGILTEAVQAAFDTIGADLPTLRLSPSARSVQLTGMRTWLAIDPVAFRRLEGEVTAGETGVTAWLEPRRVEWDLGNGDATVCEGPGTVYRPGAARAGRSPDCSYTYLATPAGSPGGTYPLSARVVYEAGYRISGPIAAGVHGLGEVPGPIAATDVAVRQWWAVRVQD